MKRKFLLIFVMLCSVCTLQAETPTVKFRARGLFDSAVSGYDKSRGTQFLYAVEDLRLGLFASYKKSDLLLDIAYSANKVVIKEALYFYNFKNGYLSVGNTCEAYSPEILIHTGDMFFHQTATSAIAFYEGRHVGASYNLNYPNYYFSTGIYSNNDINTLYSDFSDSFITSSRFVFRSLSDSQRLLQIGGAFSYRTAESTRGGNQPTQHISSLGVTSLFGESLISATIDNAGSEVKGMFEAAASLRKWRFQGEYYLNRQNIIGSNKSYNPHGGFAQFSYLLKGENFIYDAAYAAPCRPASDEAIELVARYNYTNLNDADAAIFGGSEHDFSVGINYYFNKYFALKLNGSYVLVGDHCPSFYNKNFFIGQLRAQFTL